MARKQYAVEPRQYEGRLLHQLPLLRTPLGDIYVELYLNEPSDSNGVALYRRGTRVIDDLTLLDHFARAPWMATFTTKSAKRRHNALQQSASSFDDLIGEREKRADLCF
jgi:hypothetical protein